MHSTSTIILLLLLSVLYTGCAVGDEANIPQHVKSLDSLTIYPADAQPVREIQLIREQTFGSSDEVLIGTLGGMAVDESNRVLIADPEQHTIHIIQPGGNYLTHIGRQGRGPGEFVSVFPTIISNRLFVYDALQGRVSVYWLDPIELSHTLNLNQVIPDSTEELSGLRLPNLFVRDDGKFLVSFEPLFRTPPTSSGQKIDHLRRIYYIMDDKGNIISEKIFQQRANIWLTARIDGRIQKATGFSFLGKSLIAVSENGHIFSAWSKDFLIEVRDPNGEYLRAFYYPYNNLPLTQKMVLKSQEDSEYRQRIIRQNDLPETWPALNSMLIDDENRLWVSSIVEDFEVYEWWVLKDTGELLARFTWPRNKSIEEVKNGYLYARETDEETGLQQIVRYRIEMK